MGPFNVEDRRNGMEAAAEDVTAGKQETADATKQTLVSKLTFSEASAHVGHVSLPVLGIFNPKVDLNSSMELRNLTARQLLVESDESLSFGSKVNSQHRLPPTTKGDPLSDDRISCDFSLSHADEDFIRSGNDPSTAPTKDASTSVTTAIPLDPPRRLAEESLDELLDLSDGGLAKHRLHMAPKGQRKPEPRPAAVPTNERAQRPSRSSSPPVYDNGLAGISMTSSLLNLTSIPSSVGAQVNRTVISSPIGAKRSTDHHPDLFDVVSSPCRSLSPLPTTVCMDLSSAEESCSTPDFHSQQRDRSDSTCPGAYQGERPRAASATMAVERPVGINATAHRRYASSSTRMRVASTNRGHSFGDSCVPDQLYSVQSGTSSPSFSSVEGHTREPLVNKDTARENENSPPSRDYSELKRSLAANMNVEAAAAYLETYCGGNARLFHEKTLNAYLKMCDSRYGRSFREAASIVNVPCVFNPTDPGVTISDERILNLSGDFIIHRYRLGQLIGQGASALVFTGVDQDNGRKIAIKISYDAKDCIDQVLYELYILQRISEDEKRIRAHQNPADGDQDKLQNCRAAKHRVSTLDHFFWKGRLIIISPLYGLNLYQICLQNKKKSKQDKTRSIAICEQNRKKEQMLLLIAKQVLIALNSLHDIGVIHCDVKPENIVQSSNECVLTNERNNGKDNPLSEVFSRSSHCLDVTTVGDVVLIDFGMARIEIEATRGYVQTRNYRAPELLLKLPFNTKIDIWALGCVLVEVWTGKPIVKCENELQALTVLLNLFGQLPSYMLDVSPRKYDYYDIVLDAMADARSSDAIPAHCPVEPFTPNAQTPAYLPHVLKMLFPATSSETSRSDSISNFSSLTRSRPRLDGLSNVTDAHVGPFDFTPSREPSPIVCQGNTLRHHQSPDKRRFLGDEEKDNHGFTSKLLPESLSFTNLETEEDRGFGVPPQGRGYTTNNKKDGYIGPLQDARSTSFGCKGSTQLKEEDDASINRRSRNNMETHSPSGMAQRLVAMFGISHPIAEFVAAFLTLDPLQRPSAAELLKHPILRDVPDTMIEEFSEGDSIAEVKGKVD